MKSVIEAFGDDVDIETFFSKKFLELIKEYGEVASFFGVDPIFSIMITDLNQRYSYCLHRSGEYEMEGREMVDFPLATMELRSTIWPKLRRFLAIWAPKFVQSIDNFKGEFFFSKDVATEFERIDGQFQVSLILEDQTSVTGTLILNDYEAGGSVPKCSLEMRAEDLLKSLDEGHDITQFIGGLKLSGDLGFAAKVGHTLSKGR